MSITERYAGERAEQTPLGSYAGLVGLFGLGLGALLWRARRSEKAPDRVHPGDAVAMGVATHELTRIITKDWVTAPLRAPFVEYEESLSGGEVRESSRGRGLTRAIGDLLTCPYCTAPWVALGMIAGYLEATRATRIVASLFGVAALSSWLNRAFDRLGPMEAKPVEEAKEMPAEEVPLDGQRVDVMTQHVEIHPDDVPESID